MWLMRSFWVMILLFCSAGTTVGGDSVSAPQWPLDLPTRYLTSNFMEFRSGRFHAGLDLKTETRQGYTVRAVEDGYISRLRCTPTAYGRVVYLRGESGRTYVFAHMARFNDDLRGRVERLQEQNGIYRARLEFKSGQIPVKKGDVLGLSGQSGTNGPHLHFEVRDRNQRPINPLDCGFEVDDKIPPVIHSVRAWPASAQAKIHGVQGEWVIKGHNPKGLNGDLGILKASGPIAFSSRMIDASDIRGHKLEPWLIELELDGEVVYRCENQRYAFSENSLQRLEWTNWADWTENGIDREHWLHRRPANTLAGREGELWYLGDGDQGLTAGDHKLALRVVDFAGGQAQVHWILQVGEKIAQISASGLWKPEVLGINAANFPKLDLKTASGLRLTPFYSSGAPQENGFKVVMLDPAKGDPVLEPVEVWQKGMGLTSDQQVIAKYQGLRFGGYAGVIYAADWPVESSVPLPVRLGNGEHPTPFSTIDSSRGAGMYRLKQGKQGKQWSYIGAYSYSKPGVFHFEDPGVHAVFVDIAAPVFEVFVDGMVVKPGGKSVLDEVTLPYWGVSAIGLVDEGSGVDTGTIRALFDGVKLIVEPDPPRDRVLIEWPDEMSVGEHKLEIWAEDSAGNLGMVVVTVGVIK